MGYIKKFVNLLFSRLFLVALMLAAQLVCFGLLVYLFSGMTIWMHALFFVIRVVCVILVVSYGENPNYNITWIIAILMFPMVGWAFYWLLGNKRMPKKLQRHLDETMESTPQHMPDNTLCEDRLAALDQRLAVQGRYVYNMSGHPVFDRTAAAYYPVGEVMFEAMLEKLRGAQRFIFLEYFIIRPGRMWDSVFEILRQKVADGVEVRLMYDDLGCINTLPRGTIRLIRQSGIRLHIFNPFRPRVSVILNFRDHRKLMIVDGHCAFCGGINLADEYINEYERFGHWKDTGILLEGAGAWSLTFMFLQQWQFGTGEPVDYNHYRPPADSGDSLVASGLIQPFGDTPLDRINVTETVYMGAIKNATRYIYITTPYLVIGYEMEAALCTAARSGVDVRIVTPHKYDKWFVHLLTQSHYRRLTEAGVKVYEYTPGFMHGKMFVSDDNVCMVGTCNMDFRSFHMHFECSVLFYNSPIVEQVRVDMIACQERSHLVTMDEAAGAPVHKRILRSFLKLFAPML